MSGETIATPRLNLRPPQASDAPRIAALAGDFDVARMTTSIPHPYGAADAEAFLDLTASGDPARERVFALELPGDGLIGVVGFHPRDATEIGYWIGRPYWGLGYATEAALAALTWAERDWGRRWTTAGHFADNPASGRVLEKAGFLYTGVVKAQFSGARGEEARARMMLRLA
jgi:RimJ/RimL family protein N-acetyltransferase